MKNSLLTRRSMASSAFGAVATALLAAPALAHHPFGGSAPATIMQGLVSGVGHPVIGLDHLAFVVAAGLLAAVIVRGFWVPIAFVSATLIGTGLHLAELSLPAPEAVISVSVLLFGALAVRRDRLNPTAVVLLAAIAGIFHGYAYGEAVVGAESTPLVAYLTGFAGVQSAIAYSAYCLAQRVINQNKTTGLISVRHAGFAILGAGAAFVGGLLA